MHRVDVGRRVGDLRRRPAAHAAAFDVTDGHLLWQSDDVWFGYPTTQQASAIVHEGIQVLFTTGPDFDFRGHLLAGIRWAVANRPDRSCTSEAWRST